MHVMFRKANFGAELRYLCKVRVSLCAGDLCRHEVQRGQMQCGCRAGLRLHTCSSGMQSLQTLRGTLSHSKGLLCREPISTIPPSFRSVSGCGLKGCCQGVPKALLPQISLVLMAFAILALILATRP